MISKFSGIYLLHRRLLVYARSSAAAQVRARVVRPRYNPFGSFTSLLHDPSIIMCRKKQCAPMTSLTVIAEPEMCGSYDVVVEPTR